jgi:hypothetical protein
MDARMPATDVRLTCQPNRDNRKLVFGYRLQNLGQRDIYVMDAMPSVDAATGEARANDQAAVIMHDPGGDAIIGKIIAPLPVDRRIAVRVVPLASRLEAGGTLERRLEIPEPLAETSPYLPDLSLRQYEMVDIGAVVFTIGYWVSGANGFAAVPALYAPGLFSVAGVGAALVSQRFPARGLLLFKRTDQFPRSPVA